MKSGIFIVIEGIDGSGKSTIAQQLFSYLSRKLGKEKVILTSEPTDSEHGKELRELLKTDQSPEANLKRCLELYVLDRQHHLEKVIDPALKSGKWVICDRYKYSTIVYQSLQGASIDTILELHKGMRVPDMIFILKIPAEAALQHISADKKREQPEKFEKLDFLQKAAKKFQDLPDILPHEEFIFIDSSKSISHVMKEVKKKIDLMLGF